MKAHEIRSEFLSWFEGQGHRVVPSSPLIPHNDPTLFFVNAGMVQFKDTFTGQEVRDYRRAASVQKCLRVSGKHNDLENVGRTPRHHTFFEMLGNFSFGDYFKSDAIPFAWELLTGAFQLDPNRLWVTIHHSDDEAYDIWRSIGFPDARIQRLGDKDNFWSMGDTGPCGPCTEIHWDHGPGISSETGGPATEDPRYVEIWNLVFMQYNQAADGQRTPLPRPSIDTGMGLERLAAIKQGVYSNYDTDLFQPLIQRTAKQANVQYGAADDTDTALRVVADHARAAAFLVSDGVMPSNEGRGYVLRRVMRRAIRFGVKLGMDRPFLHHVTDEVVKQFQAAYPELAERQRFIDEVVLAEEERFRRTLDRGMRLLDGALDEAGDGGTLPGDVAFTLSDTYGFPLDLTQLIAEERGMVVDADGYTQALSAQQAKGRAAWKGSGEEAVGELWHQLAETHGDTVFTGYDRIEGSGEVIALIARTEAGLEQVERLNTGEKGIALLDRTPFYGESGGQAGDTGTLTTGDGAATVTQTGKASGLHLHEVTVTTGALVAGQTVSASVDGRERAASARNHTATHLLHAALRKTLGDHVTQKGSLVAPDRLRFDLSHHKPISADELVTIEQIVNEQVLRNVALQTRVEDFESAKAGGAMALFGEKYDAEVRVVDVPGFSVELCGGTHVQRTGDIGLFRIVSESGVAAGVRRIEAQTGHGAITYVRSQEALLLEAAAALKTDPPRLVAAIGKLRDDRKAADKRIEQLEAELAKGAASADAAETIEVAGVKVLSTRVSGDLRKQADHLRDALGSGIVVLAGDHDGKALLLVACTKDLDGRIHAGKIVGQVAPLVGGRGGGRPDMAQAGGPDVSGLDAALAKALELVTAQLSA